MNKTTTPYYVTEKPGTITDIEEPKYEWTHPSSDQQIIYALNAIMQKLDRIIKLLEDLK